MIATLPSIEATADGLSISVRVVPNASRDEIVGLHGGVLKIKLASPAIEGKANKALLNFLAKELGVRSSAITIKSGRQARIKRLHLHLDEASRDTLLSHIGANPWFHV